MEFLEDVLHPQEPGRPPALEITQSWTNLRTENQNPQVIQQSLLLLERHRRSLHILESQVRILISCVRIPSSTGIEIVGSIRASAALLISTWIRRNFPGHVHNKKPTSSSAISILHTTAEAFCELLQEQIVSDFYVCQGILLLGSICSSLDCNNDTKNMCQKAIARELSNKRDAIISSCSVSDALAGVGYAILASRESLLDSIVSSLILLWIPTPDNPPLTACQMILKLFEAVGARVDTTVLDSIYTSLVNSQARNFVVIAVAGLCRGARGLDSLMKERLESLISDVADHLMQGAFHGEMQVDIFLKLPSSGLHQFRCVSFACASYIVSMPGFSVLQCMVYVLLWDVLNIYPAHSSLAEVTLESLKTLAQGVMFKQGGALVRAICIQHRKCSVLQQREIETLFWRYSLELYTKHRAWELNNVNQLPNEDLNKVREAAFLSVVMFFASAIGLLHEEDTSDRACELVVSVLDAFSCLEHLRLVQVPGAPTATQRFIQVPEYSLTTRKCVSTVSKSARAAVRLANLLPTYENVISWPGAFENTNYSWHSDGVQTSRMFFYFRVFPSCITQLDDSTFESHIVLIMFLYLCHTSKQVAEAAHNLFALFVSQRTDSVDKDDTQVSLAEQLGVYYITRSMEGYPGYTPLEGLVSGVTAIAKYLPPGSATTVHCIDELVKKAELLFSVANAKECDEAAHNIQVLLLRLVSVVDIQILPRLLEQLAKLILSLPSEAQKRGVDEAFAVISNGEDYVRKLTLVTWVQSLGFLSANQQSSNYHSRL